MKKNNQSDNDDNDPILDMLDKALADGLKKIPAEYAGTVSRHFWRLLNQLPLTTASTADAL